MGKKHTKTTRNQTVVGEIGDFRWTGKWEPVDMDNLSENGTKSVEKALKDKPKFVPYLDVPAHPLMR